MFVTYFITKLTLQAIVEECNRVAMEADAHERARYLKAKVAQLDIDFANGTITEEEYTRLGSEVLDELRAFSARLDQGQPGD
jgi:hypothetical protein